MKLDLVRACFLRRYKRFFADVLLASGELLTVHCANTGSMRTLLEEGSDAYIEHSSNPRRKLAWSLTFLGVRDGELALINTMLANRVVEEGVRSGAIEELSGYRTLRREVPYGSRRSRIDLLLDDGSDRGPCYVEVKSVTMASTSVAHRADFPDSPTERGLKHLKELTDLARQGVRVVQFYLLGRGDCTHMSIDEEIDPDYGAGVRTALESGVEFLAYRARLNAAGIEMGERCGFELH